MATPDARLTLKVYGQVIQRQRVDETLIWQRICFPDEPEERPRARAACGTGGTSARKSVRVWAPGSTSRRSTANSRRAQEPLALGRVVIGQLDERYPRAEPCAHEQLAQARKQRLVVRAALEVQDLDGHDEISRG
ncbi:MAG: hypothetical protein M3N47_01490 [Chloroflexota bacterium]|nr:hypothetical protein [Chloroflexota bacterium]